MATILLGGVWLSRQQSYSNSSDYLKDKVNETKPANIDELREMEIARESLLKVNDNMYVKKDRVEYKDNL